MLRPIAILVAAMQLSRPGMSKVEGSRYAEALNQIARENNFDPLVAVSIIHFESRWFPDRVSDDGEDYGLGQVRARFVGACRNDEDPLNDPSEACKSAKQTLLDGVTNIRRMGSIIGANKALCKEKVGSEHERHWLAGYQGLNEPHKNLWCKPGDKTSQVLDYHEGLLDKFHLRPRPKPVAKAPAKQAPQAAAKGPAKQAPQAAAKGPVAPPRPGSAKVTASRGNGKANPRPLSAKPPQTPPPLP